MTHFVEFFEFGFAKAFTSFLFELHEATFVQYLHVFGYGGAAHVELLGYRIQVKRLVCQQVNNLAAGGVGYGLENVSSHSVSGLCNYSVTNVYVTFRLRKYFAKK